MSTVLKHEMRREEEGGGGGREEEGGHFSPNDAAEWKHSAHISTQRGFGRGLDEVEKLVHPLQ